MKIYFVPFLLDFILFMVQLRLADASGREMKLSNGQTTALFISFNLAYLVVCPLVGRVLNARNTRPILLFAIASILLFGVPLLWTTTFVPALILMSGLGGAAALAFNAFQSFMRGRSALGDLAATIFKYNTSWSLGIGSGFLLGGLLKSLGQPIWLSVFCGAAVAGVFVMIWSEKPLSEIASSTGSDVTATQFGDARYIAIGWSFCLVANFVQRPLATFLPRFYAQDHKSAWMAGALLCALLWTQVAGCYITLKNPQWLYRARPLVVFQLGVTTILGGLWLSQNYLLTLFLMMPLGLLHGFAFFCAVFYCSNSRDSARNVGINEMTVGVGNIGAMLICEWAIGAWSDDAFYPTTMAFSVLLLGAQMLWLRQARQRQIVIAT